MPARGSPERPAKATAPCGRSSFEAAKAAARTKGIYLNAQYHRIAARRGGKRASVAVAHSLIVIVYYMLRDHTPYRDLGYDYFDRTNKDALARRKRLGFRVTITPAA